MPSNCTMTRAVAPPRQKRSPVQGVQSVSRRDPSAKVHLPTGQTLQVVLWKLLFQVPEGQGEHCATPGAMLYLPVSHLRHTVWFACPRAGWCIPAAQGSQSSLLCAPCFSPKVPDGQLTQAVCVAAPSCSLYVPCAHWRHSRLDPAPAFWLHVPAGHLLHVPMSVAPVAVEKVPAAHSVHWLSAEAPD
jgi:hypothetical protein